MARLSNNICIICGKLKDDTFYDKSARCLCSKECYSIYFDNWKTRDDEQYNNDRRLLINRRAAKKYREIHTDEWREYHRKYQREYGRRRRMQGC